jgi:hypothetical protein
MESYYDKESGDAKLDSELFLKLMHFFNNKLTLILNQEQIIFNPSSFRILIAAVSGTDVYLSKYGSVETLLIHRQGDRVQCIDLETKMDGETEHPRPGKVLTQILSGAIGPRDALIFANTKLAAILNDSDIQEITRESGSALMQRLNESSADIMGTEKSDHQRKPRFFRETRCGEITGIGHGDNQIGANF